MFYENEPKKVEEQQTIEIPPMDYVIENAPEGDRVTEFLQIFAEILRHSNYRSAL